MSSNPVQESLIKASYLKTHLRHTLSVPEYSFSIFENIHELSEDWDLAQPAKNTFLQKSYLSVIEENPPRGMKFRYLVFYKGYSPVGVAYCQISNFRPDASIKSSDTRDKYPCIIRAMARYLKNMVASQFDHNLLVCGNLLLTGEHGFYFHPEQTEMQTNFRILEEALIKTQQSLEEQGLSMDAIFIKDVTAEHRLPSRSLIDKSYREFTFHPNMILPIKSDWHLFEDYLAAITSKYRVRAKRAFRLSRELVHRELTTEQVHIFKNRLYELYRSVMDTASFNMVTLNENYIPSLKDKLNGQFRIFGYFADNDLVAYRTTISNFEDLEAHFLGFDQAVNRNSQIYLNMLFDTLRQGIEDKSHRIVYSRTAMEIKSSVGAKDFQMFCYIRANNKLTNTILPSLLEYLRPPDSWVARSPFK